MAATKRIHAAALRAIMDGHVLHVRAPAAGGLGRVDCTLGPDARGGFLVVDYARAPGGEERRFGDADEASSAALELLGERRVNALSLALAKVHGEPERESGRWVEDTRTVERGARLRGAYGHRSGITGPLFGPSGRGLSRG
jgi:hypothetical protein